MKKEWVQVNRGLIKDPKHRRAMGNAVWLYLYMLDRVDWKTGTIEEWTDGAVSEDLDMPKSTVKKYRQLLSETYIVCHRGQYSQSIEIKKFKNPRTRKPVQKDTYISPQIDTGVSHSTSQRDTQRDTQIDTGVPHFLLSSHNHILTYNELDDKGKIYSAMFEYFIDYCKFKRPKINSGTFSIAWDKQIKEILDLFDWDIEKAKICVNKAVKQADKSDLTINSPKSLIKIIYSISGKQKRRGKQAGTEFRAEDIR